MDELRRPGRIDRRGRATERKIFTWRVKTKVETNAQAVNDALRYCKDAITTQEQMKLLPALDAEKIAALKAGLPSIDEYQEFTGTKPREKVPPTFFPRFDHEDSSINRLMQKAQYK